MAHSQLIAQAVYLKAPLLSPLNPQVVSAQTAPTPSSSLLQNLWSPLSISIIIFLVLVALGLITLSVTKIRDVNKVLTVLFMALITSAIPFGTRLAQEQTSLQSKASPINTPKNIVVSAVTATSFTLTWETDAAAIGTIRLRQTHDPSPLQKILTETNHATNYTHALTVSDLNPNTDYYFEILSGSEWYNLNGEPIKVHTKVN